jgi:hypothetical protein
MCQASLGLGDERVRDDGRASLPGGVTGFGGSARSGRGKKKQRLAVRPPSRTEVRRWSIPTCFFKGALSFGRGELAWAPLY